MNIQLNDGQVLVLKSLPASMLAYNNFKWPQSGFVSAPDWNPEPICGGGLHGWLWGEGDASLRCTDSDAVWLVLLVDGDKIVDLKDKIKFPACDVLYCGDRATAVAIISEHAPANSGVMFSFLTGGDDSTLTGGDDSTLTGGDGSTLTGGDRSTLTGGDDSTLTGGSRSTLTGGDGSTLTGGHRSTLTGGHGSTLTGGNRSTLTGGHGSTLTGGHGSTLTGGDGSTLTGGHGSTLTGGDGSTLTGGNRSTLTGGHGSTLTGGDDSVLIFREYCQAPVVGIIDSNVLRPGVAYKCEDSQIVPA